MRPSHTDAPRHSGSRPGVLAGRPRPLAGHRAPLAAALLVAGLLLSGCTPGGGGDGETGTGPVGAASGSGQEATGASGAAAPAGVPEGLQDYYAQDPQWQGCEQDRGDFECATVNVPLDYADPGGDSIELALVRSAGAGGDAPHLLVNPGGPGVSGVDMVVEGLDYAVSADVQEHYTVVGFDPRGVSRSTPITCLTDEELDEAREGHVDPSTDEGLQELRESAREFAEACDEHTGEVLGHVDTESSARDMDLLRAVLGDERLNFLGFSYGTDLGATYAGLFPGNVGRMVLDGAMDPSLPESEVVLAQAAAYEEALRSWAEYCLAGSDCPLSGTPENAVAQVQRLLKQVEQSPMTASDGRQVPVSTLVSGMIVALNADESWPVLTMAVQDAMNGSPDLMLHLADLGAGRQEDGTYDSNVTAAITAVKCLDGSASADTRALREQAAQLDEASPTLGRFLAYSGLYCAVWPEAPVGEPAPVSAPGAAPIVVIGTTGDTATPYEWARVLADQLESAVLVTWEGQGHTAYGRAGDCIENAVDAYLIDGTVPEDGLTCD
ncbi:MAG: alpha/beta hydrolase [Micrococcus sp.]|nr:alpha/beta hydrolase [Micrococcus sp.]